MNEFSYVSCQDENLQITNEDSKICFDNKKILIIAKRCTAKSLLCAGILDLINKDQINKFNIICPTEKVSPFYSYKYDCEISYKLSDLNLSSEIKNIDNEKAILVLDDCIPLKFINFNAINELCTQYNLTLIIVLQYPFFSKEIVNMFDYVFISHINYLSTRDKIYKSISTALTKKEFNDALINMPPFNFMMFSNNVICNNEITVEPKITKLNSFVIEI
jgi:hypothetical protein